MASVPSPRRNRKLGDPSADVVIRPDGRAWVVQAASDQADKVKTFLTTSGLAGCRFSSLRAAVRAVSFASAGGTRPVRAGTRPQVQAGTFAADLPMEQDRAEQQRQRA